MPYEDIDGEPIRRRLLGAEMSLRGLAHGSERSDNRYEMLHLEEARLLVLQAIVQIEYAELATTDPNRGGKQRCFTCTEPWQDCHCAE